MPAGSFLKDPVEHYPVGINMARQLPSGRTVSRATVSATDLTEPGDATSTVLARTTASKTSDTTVEVEVKAGTSFHSYKIFYTIYDNANSVYRESLLMWVRPV